MDVHVRCKCGREFRVPEDRAGKPFKCFVCQRVVITSGDADSPPAEPAQPTEQASVKVDPDADRLRALNRFAAEQVVAGAPASEIERQLVEKGYDSEAAGAVVARLKEARSQGRREAAHQNLLIPALWCLGGIVVTVLTYSMATNLGGAKYVIAVGPILYGGYRLFTGLSQLGGQEQAPPE
jgi:hypothetical protein